MFGKLLSVALIAMVGLAITADPVLAGVSAVGEIKNTPQNHPGLILDWQVEWKLGRSSVCRLSKRSAAPKTRK
ncbi:MAG: hypothetical protein IT342_23445 [Candidatus Melainabacteria bacterium]|nr:hypothetical protein [Candidatus Melainabacteria bacterium]